MGSAAIDERWRALTEEVALGMREWRAAHPRASLRAIEDALDERWAAARAQLLAEIALTSQDAQVARTDPASRPRCPDCGTALVANGQHTRTLTVQGEQSVHLTRDYARCPACGAGLFPPG
jgi:hypothetical protein